MKVVDDVGGVAPTKVGHGDADLLVVVLQVDAHVLLQLLARMHRGVGGVFIENAALELVPLSNLPAGVQTAVIINLS